MLSHTAIVELKRPSWIAKVDFIMRMVLGVGHWRLIGGSERYALETARQLVARGHEVTVLHGSGVGTPEPGLRFEQFKAMGELEAPKRDRHELRNSLARLKPDLIFQLTPCAAWVIEEQLRAAPLARFVQDHTLFCPGLNKMLAGGKPCQQSLGRNCLTEQWFGDGCHGFSSSDGARTIIQPAARLRTKQRELAMSARAQLLLVASGYMREQLIMAGLPPERVQVLPYCTHAGLGPHPKLDPKGDLPEATRRFLRGAEGPMILTPARLTLPDKGVDYLLTALTKVAHPLHAIIAGSGPAADWLQQKAREEGLADRVHFTGWLESDALSALYECADLVAFPSVWDEPFGLVGIEAMAHGVPVVAFDVGGVGEWLAQGVGGWSVPRRDVDAMARAITRALENPKLRADVAESGRRRVERDFRPERYYNQLERHLRACLQGTVGNLRSTPPLVRVDAPSVRPMQTSTDS